MARIYTKKEMKKRKLTLKVFAGLFDFVGTVAALFVALFCIILLSNLFGWLKTDIPQTFTQFTKLADMALSLDEDNGQQ